MITEWYPHNCNVMRSCDNVECCLLKCLLWNNANCLIYIQFYSAVFFCKHSLWLIMKGNGYKLRGFHRLSTSKKKKEKYIYIFFIGWEMMHWLLYALSFLYYLSFLSFLTSAAVGLQYFPLFPFSSLHFSFIGNRWQAGSW